MKKTLLAFAIGLFATVAINAQTLLKTWDFGNDTANVYPIGTAQAGTNFVTDNMGFVAKIGTPTDISSFPNFEVITGSLTWTEDNYKAVVNGKGIRTGGGSSATNNMPLQRFLFFNVNGGNYKIKMWYRLAGSPSRYLYLSDGTNLLATTTGNLNNTSYILEYDTTSPLLAGNVYVYGSSSMLIYKIEVYGYNGATLGTASLSTLSTTNIKGKVSAQVFASGKTVFLKDLKAKNAEVKVFNLNGGLVKTLNTSKDTQFDLNSGLYLITVKTNEGEKSVKVSVK